MQVSNANIESRCQIMGLGRLIYYERVNCTRNESFSIWQDNHKAKVMT